MVTIVLHLDILKRHTMSTSNTHTHYIRYDTATEMVICPRGGRTARFVVLQELLLPSINRQTAGHICVH